MKSHRKIILRNDYRVIRKYLILTAVKHETITAIDASVTVHIRYIVERLTQTQGKKKKRSTKNLKHYGKSLWRRYKQNVEH